MSLSLCLIFSVFFFFFQAEDGIRDWSVTGVQTCALPISIQLRREGRDIISLSVGEPDFPVFPHVEAAISEALRKGQTKYTEIGRASCRERVESTVGSSVIKKKREQRTHKQTKRRTGDTEL